MRKRLPPLNALRTFEAAARHCSFAAAGEELCVSHSAVSHQIRKLEQHLGLDLFLRVAKGVELTKSGRSYYPAIRDAFDRIAAGTDLILAPAAPDVVTLQLYSTFAIRWLIPRLPTFQQQFPNIRVRLHTSQSDVNFEHEDVDLCVMIGTPTHLELRYEYLFSSRVFPVCSPSLLQTGAPLEQPKDLANHVINHVYPSQRDWWVWLEANQVEGLNLESDMQFDSYDLAFNAAVQSLGVSLGMEPFVNRDIDSGVLVEPFPGRRVFTPGDWYLVCRKDRSKNEKVSVFRDWLLEQVAADPALIKTRRGSISENSPPPAAESGSGNSDKSGAS